MISFPHPDIRDVYNFVFLALHFWNRVIGIDSCETNNKYRSGNCTIHSWTEMSAIPNSINEIKSTHETCVRINS